MAGAGGSGGQAGGGSGGSRDGAGGATAGSGGSGGTDSTPGDAGCGRGGSGCRGGSGGAGAGGSGSTTDATIARDSAATGGTGGTGGMPTDLATLCQRYCDCMSNHNQARCKSRTPANCMSTCMQQGRNWDITCRIDKCVKARTDYMDQIEGDCKAAIGDQACFDIE